MTSEQVKAFVELRVKWFPHASEVTDDLRKHVWEPSLQPIPKDVAWEAVKRYARKQRNHHAPSLDDILICCEEVEDDHRRAAAQARRDEEDRKSLEAWQTSQRAWIEERQGLQTAEAGLPGVLGRQVTDQGGMATDRGLFAQLMVTLTLRHCGPWHDDEHQVQEKLGFEACAAQCYAWAQRYEQERPALADDLLVACRQFEAMDIEGT